MKILSFDVGIINLAYCLLEIDENKKWTILKWGIIDISPKKKITCGAIYKGSVCGNKACFKYKDKFSCSNKRCVKYYTAINPTIKQKKLPKQNHSLDDLSMSLLEKLAEIEWGKIDKIVIENQPVLKNPTMKSIQMVLYSYFQINRKTLEFNEIRCFCAKNKLGLYDGPEIKNKYKSEYANRKYKSVEQTKYFIKEFKDWYSFFINENKKDDLADCFLQGLVFISKLR